MQAFSDGDLATFASMYADTVDYMESGRTSNAGIQRQLSEYFTKWPVRQWSIVGPIKVEPAGPTAQRVIFSAQYDLSNSDTNRHAAGIAKETLIVKDDGTGVMKITSHHEKTSSSSGSDTASDKKGKRRGQRERVVRRPTSHSPAAEHPLAARYSLAVKALTGRNTSFFLALARSCRFEM